LQIEIDSIERGETSQSEAMNLATLSTENPSTDNKKIPDLLDFDIIKSIPKHYCCIEFCLELNSVSPIIIIVNSKIITKDKPFSAMSKQNGPMFRS